MMSAHVSAPCAFVEGARSSFWFQAPGASPVLVYAYCPTELSKSTRVVVVVHGTLRNADDYIEGWTRWAEWTGHLILAPRFDRVGWPGSKGFHLGNVLHDGGPGGARNEESSWAFTVVEELHERIRSELALEDRGFALWGHSAGGQFVHRFLLFKPRAKVWGAFAAGCGWFTVPDLGTRFPYGLEHPNLGFTESDAREFVRSPLTIVRGTLDTGRDVHLRRSRAAEAQGSHRYARAGHMYRVAQHLDPSTSWRLVDVPGVGHDWSAMAAVAQTLLEER